MKNPKYRLECSYDAALAQWKEASRAFTKVRDAYRAKTVGDAEYLEARETFERAQSIMDEKETEFITDMNALNEDK